MLWEPPLRCAAALLLALVASLVVTPVAMRLAVTRGILAYPTDRGVHRAPIPYLGGFGLLAGILAGLSLVHGVSREVIGLAVGGLLVAAAGSIDDARNTRWWVKLIAQIAIALGVWAAGVRIEEISPPYSTDMVRFGWWSAPLTALWLVAVMNAINFIDGLDGLAAGVSAIAGATFVAIAMMWLAARGAAASYYDRYYDVAVLAAALVGACLGFLRYNFHPARVFMGDCGALLLGLWLGGLSVLGAFKSTLLYLCPIVLLGLPLSDTAWAVARRLMARRSFAEADQGHIHHRVLNRVPEQRKAVLILYAVSLALASVATWLGRP